MWFYDRKRYSFWGYLPAAIAARGIWNSYIDFPLGLAATGGLTSGSALPILFFFYVTFKVLFCTIVHCVSKKTVQNYFVRTLSNFHQL